MSTPIHSRPLSRQGRENHDRIFRRIAAPCFARTMHQIDIERRLNTETGKIEYRLPSHPGEVFGSMTGAMEAHPELVSDVTPPEWLREPIPIEEPDT